MNKFTREKMLELLESPGMCCRINHNMHVEHMYPTTIDEKVLTPASIDIWINVERSTFMIYTVNIEDVKKDIDAYVNHVNGIVDSPLGFYGGVLLSYGFPVKSLYSLDGLDVIYKKLTNLEDNKFMLNVRRRGMEQIIIVNVYPEHKKTILFEIPETLNLTKIVEAFRFKNLSREEKKGIVERFVLSSSFLFERWARAVLDTINKTATILAGMNQREIISREYSNTLVNLFVEHIFDSLPVSKIVKTSIEDAILAQVSYNRNIIDEIRLYSLNENEMVVAIKLTRRFLNDYAYTGPTVFKLKTTMNIFNPGFEFNKNSNAEIVSAINNEMMTINHDFNVLRGKIEDTSKKYDISK